MLSSLNERERRWSPVNFFYDKYETTITNQSSQGYHQRSISSIRVTDPLTARLYKSLKNAGKNLKGCQVLSEYFFSKRLIFYMVLTSRT